MKSLFGSAALGGVSKSFVLIGASLAACYAAQAGDYKPSITPSIVIDEVRIGAFKQDIEGSPGEGSGALNIEVLFERLQGRYENRIIDHFLRPRPHLGTTLAFGKTSEFYFGATWDIPLTDWVFIETSFGGALHDGPLDKPGAASYGCTLNFRESASLGFNLSEEWRLLFTVDHMSNAGLCDVNRGLTNAGVRLGYKW